MDSNPNFIKENLEDLCASIQYNLVQILTKKLKKAAFDTNIREIGIAGGVAANSRVRSELTLLAKKHGWTTYFPKFEYCTDNAAMIAIAAHYKFITGNFTDQSVSADPKMKI